MTSELKTANRWQLKQSMLSLLTGDVRTARRGFRLYRAAKRLIRLAKKRGALI